MKLYQKVLLIIVLFFYIYFRITPIINQTVPYTYDQGRDFLKAREIVSQKNLTLIGPTTGLEGIFHGVWIYYFLTIPYILFSGNPIGFYYLFFFINLIANFLFFIFLYKKLNFNSGLFFLLLTNLSSYFVKNSFFPSNDHLAPLFILAVIYFSYKYISKKEIKFLFLTVLSAGFVLESEFAFGLFLIPSLFFTFIFLEKKQFFKKIPIFLLALIPASFPRIIFEIKHNFLQTKNFFKYLTLKNPIQISWQQIIADRLNLFFNYLNEVLSFKYISIFFLLFFVLLIIFKKITFKKEKLTWLKFNLLLLFIIFILTIIYKKNPFYSYYLNGIEYIYLVIVILTLNQKNLFTKYFYNLLIAIFFIFNLISFKNSIITKKIPLVGLRADNRIINYFIKNESKDYFCLRIYTPPVIPYTYQYLLTYYADKNIIKYPKGDFYKNKCYFIIDKEPYEFRVKIWREENTPKNTKLTKIIKFENGTNIELWKEEQK
ncbi:MAG: hypothetical protein Fur009_5070 [Candidatus Microgenomates bacterium]